MTPHPDEGTLQRLQDGELDAAEHEAAERHLAACPACRAERAALERALRTVARAAARLDDGGGSPELAHAAWRRRMRGGWARRLPRAAALLLGVAGVASATLPGSPLRRWIETAWPGDSPAVLVAEPRPVVDHPAGVDSGAEIPSAGVGVFPEAGEVRVVVNAPSPALRIRVRLEDQAQLSVRGRGAAAAARFRTGPGRVTVEEAGAGELEVILPRGARRASVVVDGRRFLLREGGELRLLVPADSVGAEVVFPVRF